MGVTNLRGTQERLRRLGELPERRMQALMRVLTLEGFAGVLDATPVDSGRLRGGWDVSIGAPSDRVPPDQSDRVEADKRGRKATQPNPPVGSADQDASARALSVVSGIPAFTIVYITNNTPYSETVNNGGFVPANPGPSKDPRPGRFGQELVVGGFSTQAPAGMLRNGLTRIAFTVRRAAGALPR